ncbi:hypothetical protein DFJ74DRAFT_411107 [Hyaloraphidium curvatum]|nr:hypothetical protein DFJ74DRAFT_411107 [Hyaloraphidium curvatum]
MTSVPDAWFSILAVTRTSDAPAEPAPSVGTWRGKDHTHGNGASTAAMGFNAMFRELEHAGSKCSQPVTFRSELLAGLRKGDTVEIAVERSRDGGRFAFLKATIWTLGQGAEEGKKRTIVANLSAIFCDPSRNGKAPPFPPTPPAKRPPKMEECVSLFDLMAALRRPNTQLTEAWDAMVPAHVADGYRKAVAESQALGEDAAALRSRISRFASSLDPTSFGWYYRTQRAVVPSGDASSLFGSAGHTSGHPSNHISCVLWDDMFTPQGFLNLFVGDIHPQFPLLSLVFDLNFVGAFEPEHCRGLWAKIKYKGDFGDLEEREIVLRDEIGRPVCVARQIMIWRRPLKLGEKL